MARPAFPGPDRLLLPAVGPGLVRVDGDLAEWAGRPFVYLSDRWQRIQADSELPAREDRAAAALARDGEALFVAFRVVDEEVANTHPENLWRGDCVELFVDVRREGDGLGEAPYSPGCYQLVFSPVSLDGEVQPRWRCLQTDPGAPDKLQVASALLEDGYAVEVRIPFVELDGASGERFESPVGIDVQVDDAILGADGNCSDRVAYSWRGIEGSYQSPQVFGRTVPMGADARAAEVVTYVRPRPVAGLPRPSVVAGVAALAEPPRLELEFRYEGTRGDRPLREENWEVPAGTENAPHGERAAREWDDEMLGLKLREQRIELSRLIGGRYYFTAECGLPGGPVTDEEWFYYYEAQPEGQFRRAGASLEGDELIGALAGSLYADLESPHWVFTDRQMRLRIYEPAADCAWGVSEGLGAAQPVGVELRLSPLGDERQTTAAFQQVLSPRGAAIEFRTDDLPDGVYKGRLYVLLPEGEARPVVYPEDGVQPEFWPNEIVGIQRGRDYELSAVINDGADMLTRAVPVGDPYRERFPQDDEAHCFGRSIWDMQLYEGRIYTGCGDWNRNQGPIDILSFGPPEGEGALSFRKEFTIDGESVEAMRMLEGRLVVPDIDPQDPWELGNLYIKHEGEWVKRRTIPNGIHCFDAAYHDDRLYVATGTEAGAALYASEDWGETWETVARAQGGDWMEGRYYQVAPVGKALAVVASRSDAYIYLLVEGELRRVIQPFLPGAERCWYPHRLTPFAGKLLYAPRLWTEEDLRMPAPLYLMRDFEEGGWLVDGFQERQVHDIIVRGGSVFVLTSEPAWDGYACELLHSPDARNWTRIAEFATPARAESLEELAGVFYVGLASAYEEANPAAGRICRLE